MASVVFSVSCQQTRPGEAVFVVGTGEHLGSWVTEKARPMTTTRETFPVWSSQPIEFPAGRSAEYKFIVQSDTLTGSPQWEDFPGNRIFSVPEAGATVTVKSAWNDIKSSVIKKRAEPRLDDQVALSMLQQEAVARKAKEDINWKMADSNVEVAAAETQRESQLAVTIASREYRRQNFSQSLLILDDENEPQAMGGTESEKPAAEVERPSAMLKHIMSFSALTEMLDPEEKEENRKSNKATASYEPKNLNVPVVIVSSEIAPYSKTGGLGLVAASYSYEFARKGHRTMAVSPKYKQFDGITLIGETSVLVDGRHELVKYWHKYEEYGEGTGTDFLFVDHPSIERDGGLYSDNNGREFPDNLLRFTLLSMAAMEAPLILEINGRKYGDKVLFLANDWQAGLVPLQLCYKYRRSNAYLESRCIYVIHNMGYQGQYNGVDAAKFYGVEHQACCDLAYGKNVNLTKGALICCDRVITVSPNYAKEIQTPGGGFNLQDFVKTKQNTQRLAGILNGIDDCWNPLKDTAVPVKFCVEDFETGKRRNKELLQRRLDLRVDPNVVLVGFVGRLTWQKGVDVLQQCVDWMMQDTGNGVTGHCQLIMMGNGEKTYSDMLKQAEESHKGRVCGYVGFDPKVEHQMMAGCDLFLMPSRYEPCGLPQMYSQQYGTLPVVTATGGLVDSVVDVSEGVDVATGFFLRECTANIAKETLYKAMELYLKRPEDFKTMQRTAMQKDFYWPQAMDEYEKNIDAVLQDPATAR